MQPGAGEGWRERENCRQAFTQKGYVRDNDEQSRRGNCFYRNREPVGPLRGHFQKPRLEASTPLGTRRLPAFA